MEIKRIRDMQFNDISTYPITKNDKANVILILLLKRQHTF